MTTTSTETFTFGGKTVDQLPCCGIHALAEVTHQPFQAVWDAYKAKNHKGPKWRGRTHVFALACLGRALGFEMTRVANDTGTLEKFAEWHTKKDTFYLVRIGGHFVALRNGVVSDQGGVHSIDKYTRRRGRVTHAYEVQ